MQDPSIHQDCFAFPNLREDLRLKIRQRAIHDGDSAGHFHRQGRRGLVDQGRELAAAAHYLKDELVCGLGPLGRTESGPVVL
ncbi:hypothetical protein GCM10010523_23110 [Paenarthrobacter ilicis]